MPRVLACLGILVCLLAAAGTADAKTKWLCKPGAKPDPCVGDLTASVIDTNGNVLRTERTRVAKAPRVDCFYVYPTVSSQTTTNANLNVDPEETAIAEIEAQRFSQDCRVWAPMYREFTVPALLAGHVTARAQAIAYAGVRDAWHKYLRKYNHGRGVILVGHSQGTGFLRQLATAEIDKKLAERRLLVSALLIGGNVTVPKGKGIGGDFQHIPACRRSTQTGCVVAYSMFNATPPTDAFFGRVVGSKAKTDEILCTNPAALGGGSAVLRSYGFDQPFPGLLGIAVNEFTGPLPQLATPWLIPPGRHTAHCSSAGGAHVLMLTPSDGARVFTPAPDPRWGWHLGDMNLALGDLTSLARTQAAAWLKHNG